MILRGATRYTAAMLLAGGLLVTAGCGYKDMPVPPEEVVPLGIEDLRYTLEGNSAQLRWSYPMETIKGTDIQSIDSFDLYRAEIAPEEYCPSCPIPFGKPVSLPGGIPIVDGKRRVAEYESGMLRTGYTYFYKVKARTSWWAASPDSNIVTFLYHQSTAAPQELKTVAGDSLVRLSWQPVNTLADGSPTEGEVVYQVLREVEGKFVAVSDYVVTNSFVDRNVENDTQYRYQVQPLLQVTDQWVAGAVTDPVTVTPRDLTPPAPPQGVYALEAAGSIKIIWDSSLEEDLAGYRVYRRERGSKESILLGTVEDLSTIFEDTSARENRRYYYSVTAIDNGTPPNESKKSKEVTTRD